MAEVVTPTMRFVMVTVGILMIVVAAAMAIWAFFTSPFTQATTVADSFVNTLNVIAYLAIKLGFVVVVIYAGAVLLGKAAQFQKVDRE